MAREIELRYEGLDIEAEYTLDIRGRSGIPGVSPFFKSVRAVARVHTDETDHRLREATEATDSRCPMYNLIKAAGVDIEVRWERAVE